ncbi:MAG: mandelate racemase/muconate lactonizing enzyme family protein [Planctomycetes bacterium]|nr:mandelate racemase/muconate lactonizing enzyme family protein [Planctomycetota bacterium]
MERRPTDVRPEGCSLYFLPIRTRLPLKFGTETVTSVTCARAALRVRDERGRAALGWGETPLSVQWVWPSSLPYDERHEAMVGLSADLAREWAAFPAAGHPVEVGLAFQEGPLVSAWRALNARRAPREAMPWLAALVASSPFDIALHDGYGKLHEVPVYETYGPRHMNGDLARQLEPAPGAAVSFAGRHLRDFLVLPRPASLPAWHLVGGMDAVDPEELDGTEPRDGHPVLLRDWIRRDGLRCLKVKLRGNDFEWDCARLRRVAEVGIEEGADWLSADFNCTVTDPAYVNEALDKLLRESPRAYGMLLYVEQPFPYDLEAHRVDVRSVSARKPLFMDESAHDWRLVRLGRDLGWSGVALKTCKTQTGALLSLAWAKAHGMTLMVQDLTNPMLAMVPHALLAAHAGTVMGVETNAMQFYPEASRPEAAVHPGLYERRGGRIDLGTVRGPGFGYRLEEIRRELPRPAVEF